MVSYQTWTSIAFEVADEKGAEYENIAEGGQAISIFAEIWRERQVELESATRTEARDIARQEIVTS